MKTQYALRLLVACVIVLSTSCDDDDDKDAGSSLVGSWVWRSWKTVDCEDADDLFDTDGCDDGDCYVFTFNSDGSFFGDYDGEVSGTYELSGDQLTTSEKLFESEVTKYKVEFDNDRLIVTSTVHDPDYGCYTQDTLTRQ